MLIDYEQNKWKGLLIMDGVEFEIDGNIIKRLTKFNTVHKTNRIISDIDPYGEENWEK